MKNRRSGFTLVEILVVLGIIALLAALLFPAFGRARESARQTSCASNLSQIYLAVTQYKQDEGRYPGTLIDLLGENAPFNNGGAAGTLDSKAGGYFKGGQDSLVCPDDETDAAVPRSSYGILNKVAPTTMISTPAAPSTFGGEVTDYVWNYLGYRNDGFAYANPSVALTDNGNNACVAAPATPTATCLNLVDPSRNYNDKTNPVKFSLSNRFAPPSTIITHCVYHRLQTAKLLNSPTELYADPANSSNSHDIVLRLDGSAKSTDVTLWGPPAASPTLWQKQTQ